MLAIEVSNRNVLGRIAVTVLLLAAALYAQKTKRSADAAMISRAKHAIISEFDPALPNLALESFLKYETEDAPIDWSNSGCADTHTTLKLQTFDGKCVTAYSSLPDGRVITVTVRVPNDASSRVSLASVAVIDRGLEHRIQLIEIPAVIQGARPLGQPRKGPRDLLPLSRVG
jgi:hypothetical protein